MCEFLFFASVVEFVRVGGGEGWWLTWRGVGLGLQCRLFLWLGIGEAGGRKGGWDAESEGGRDGGEERLEESRWEGFRLCVGTLWCRCCRRNMLNAREDIVNDHAV